VQVVRVLSHRGRWPLKLSPDAEMLLQRLFVEVFAGIPVVSYEVHYDAENVPKITNAKLRPIERRSGDDRRSEPRTTDRRRV
jgi:hypothetical protein